MDRDVRLLFLFVAVWHARPDLSNEAHMDDPSSESVIDTIIQAAERLGRTQKALAEAAGVSRENVSRIKQRGSARLDVLERLACGVGLRVVAVPAEIEPGSRPVMQTQQCARRATFKERHPELVWPNSPARPARPEF
ncbi:transcriptional regulator with XRE-family HTH domain [Paraburkholderia sp. GAS333]|uniref:helix-turn-helix transcriptional regulator n=1 Tax=Paraburkholderia sp. GAS333 TaxID=3156279 RepID=UPI003D220E04